MANILVTGATGFIGRHLCAKLIELGNNVKIVIRRGKNYTNFPVPIKDVIALDWPYGIYEDVAKGQDFLIHCANSPETRNKKLAQDANFLSTKLLCKAAEKSKTALIYISSQSANKDVKSLYAENKLASEEHIKDIFKGNWTIIRPGMVYGQGSSGLFAKIQYLVDKYPVIPLINGGNQLIQPIHVLDLVEAITKIVKNQKKHNKKTYCLGDNEGIKLKDFLKISSVGKRRLFVNFPSWLASGIISFVSQIAPIPISSDNIQGLVSIKKMKTSDSLTALNLKLRPIKKELANKKAGKSYAALKAILVGTGKRGTIHFQNLKEFPYVKLAGLVEKDRGKAKLLASFGNKEPIFEDISQAIKAVKSDLAIICTPTFTHFSIIEECLKNNIHCFVEKPLVLNGEENIKLKKLLKNYPKIKISVGYLTSHYKHVKNLAQFIKKGKFGKVQKVEAVYYLSHIMDSSEKGWETKKSLSGGGVVINSGVHTLNTLCTLFGADFKILNKKTEKIYSKDVEDKLDAQITLGGKKVSLEFNWSKPGHPTVTNFIKIYTTKGLILLDSLGYMFKSANGKKEFLFSDTEEVSFNLSPEQGASGFVSELEDFFRSIIYNKKPLTNPSHSIQVEKLAHALEE